MLHSVTTLDLTVSEKVARQLPNRQHCSLCCFFHQCVVPCLVEVRNEAAVKGKANAGDLTPDGSNTAGEELLIQSLGNQTKLCLSVALAWKNTASKKGRKAFHCSASHSLSQGPNRGALTTQYLIVNSFISLIMVKANLMVYTVFLEAMIISAIQHVSIQHLTIYARSFKFASICSKRSC